MTFKTLIVLIVYGVLVIIAPEPVNKDLQTIAFLIMIGFMAVIVMLDDIKYKN